MWANKVNIVKTVVKFVWRPSLLNGTTLSILSVEVYKWIALSLFIVRTLVSLASASLTWYQSPGSRVRILAFAIYPKFFVAPWCPCIGLLSHTSELPVYRSTYKASWAIPLSHRSTYKASWAYLWVSTRVDLSSPSRVGVLKCINGLH
jgi:hypothetical protein